MPELTRPQRTRAMASLVVSRAVYAYNWYNVGPIQLAIAAGLTVSFDALSWALWVFLVGVACFQLPAGMISLKWGVRSTALAGASLLGAGAVGSALAPSYDVFLATRFVVGVGAALFFSPGISLVARYYLEGGRGWGIGLFNGAFALGSSISVLATVLLAQAWGWRYALAVAALAMLVATAQSALLLPRLPEVSVPATDALRRTIRVGRSTYLWLLSLALVGFWASNFTAAQYLVPWAESVRGLSPTDAGTLGTLLIALPFVGAPLGGRWIEWSPRPTRVLAFSVILTGAGFAGFPFAPTWALVPLAVGDGLAAGVGVGGLYYLGTLDPSLRLSDLPLAVAFINFVQTSLGGFLVLLWGVLLFGRASNASFTDGWLVLAAVTSGMVALLLGVGKPGESVVPPATRAAALA